MGLSVRFLQQGDMLSQTLLNKMGKECIAPGDNVIVVVDEMNVVRGILAGRAVHFITGLWFDEGVGLQRLAADRMISFGLGWLNANNCKQVIFASDPDNTVIRDVAKSFGAADEEKEARLTYLNL